jgi:hypothetical protein
MTHDPMKDSSANPAPTFVASGDLLASAERMGDKTESIYAAEWYLLRQIAERASDLVNGEHWEEFRYACGGIDNLKAKHAEAVAAYEKWLSDGEG